MGHAMLLLPVVGEPVLLTDARKHRPDLVVVDDVRAAGDLGLGLIDLLKETYLEDGNVGLVGDDILPAAIDRQLLHELPGLTLDPEPNIVASMRALKSPGELDLLRRAARLCRCRAHDRQRHDPAWWGDRARGVRRGDRRGDAGGRRFRALFPGAFGSLVGVRIALATGNEPNDRAG